jgi:hypothetical protein
MLRLAVALLLLLAPALACAQVYKCKDKNGKVIYTQTKPAGADCSGDVPTAPAPASDGSDPLKGFSDEVGKSREAEAKTRDAAAQEQAQRAARCAQWRQRLAALERASKVFTVDEKGERHYRSDAQNDAMREEARQGVATECG